MAPQTLGVVVRHARRLVEARPPGEQTDGQLLRRFIAAGDGLAFEELVRRHGAMVLGVCRRVLANVHDAEDAFQATFLVLARRAGSLTRPERVANWLHGVALRVAREARGRRTRRDAEKSDNPAVTLADPADEALREELRSVLDEELDRLPEKYRAPVVLCHLEGQTHACAARALRVPVGSMSWRLARALDLLRQRLVRRGVTLSAGALAGLLPVAAAPCSVPPGLLASTAGVGALLVRAEALLPGAVSARAAALAQGALTALTPARLRGIAALVLAIALIGTGAAVVAQRDAPDPAPASQTPAAGTDKPAPEKPDLPPGALARIGSNRLRHGGHVGCVVYSPDGKLLASGGGDHAVRLWEADTGKPVRHLLGHTDRPGGIAFSPDGKLLASGGTNDRTIILWEVATGRELRRLKTPESVTSVRFSPDGKRLVSGSWDKAIHLWEVATGRHLRRFDGHDQRVFTVVFSPDGSRLASCGWDDRTIRLWDVESGKELRQFGGGAHEVGCVAFAPDRKVLVSGGKDGPIRLWDVESGKELRRLVGHPSFVSSFVFSADGKLLASGSYDKTVRLWDVGSGKEIRTFGKHNDIVYQVAFSPDGKTLASAGQDSMVRLWDVATGKERRPPEGHTHIVACAVVSPNGKALASADHGGEMVLWDLTTGKLLRRWRSSGKVYALAFAPDGKRLAGFGEGWAVWLWDVPSGKELRTLRGPADWRAAVAFSADGKVLTVAASNGTLLAWEADTGKAVPGSDSAAARQNQPLTIESPPAARPVFSPDGRLLATAVEGPLRFREVATGKVRHTAAPESRPVALAFSRDAKLVVSATWAQEGVQLWETATLKELHRLQAKPKTHLLALSPDGRLLATASYVDGTIWVWDVATGKEVRRLEGHHGQVSSLGFSPNGKVLVSAGWDTTVLLWDVAGLVPRPRLTGKLSPEALGRLWADLAGEGGPGAYKALCGLADAPAQSVPFLRERLKPAAVVDPRSVAALLKELGSTRFEAREKAMRALEKMGEEAEPGLRQALRDEPPLEIRRRVEQLLAKLETWPPERRRTYRALQVLEQAGTAEARQLLGTLAGGAPGAWLTREARACLDRLARSD
ncbi:MAG: sigma-70 family RNA polymerase sigma factor [Gemmataceae bacterium]|nr:sigma-70 family RNA polymerase sigma factor [Gemmataceae bacterium]